MPSGKHAVVPAAAFAVSAAAVPAALSGTIAPAVPDVHAVRAVLDVEVARQMPAPRPLVTRFVSRAARKSYTIVSGDTLSGIAGRFCQAAAKWPALFNGNRTAVKDPDMIFPGQKLTLTCDGSTAIRTSAATAAAVAPAAAAPVRHADRFDGHRGACGDGDGDGFDMPCSLLHHHQAAADPAPHAAVRHAAVAAVTGVSGGTLSFAGLEALWESAGGPAWAAAAAAAVAECESGGNSGAHNPSGATGLWQILGAVVGGDLKNPAVNAENAVSKFRASGDTWAQWVCKP